MTRTIAVLGSIGSVALALLLTQHHNVHVLVLALGAGSAGMGFLAVDPTVRRAMLLISLVVTVAMIARLWRGHGSRMARIGTSLSIVLTLGLLAWSVLQFGV